ncbi:MAG: hypothetical protein GC179_00545 [Anaerolineaceae bacterium]|nr:hypothetical protein [Anaerolineaceae bacterium]
MSEASSSGGCLGFVFTMIAVIIGAFMTAFNQSSAVAVPLPSSEIVTHISLAPIGTFTTEELQQASRVISKRLDGLGLSTAAVEVIDNKTIRFGLPQVDNLDNVLETLSARGLLEFVDFSDVPAIGSWAGHDILTTGQGDHPISESAVKNPVTNQNFETVLTGDGIQSAEAVLNQDFGGQWQVNVEFSDEAGKILGDYTRTHIGMPLALVLDGKVLSVPLIQAEISTQAVIVGNFTEQEAKRMAVQLGSGALPFEMQTQIIRIGVLRGDFGQSVSTAAPTAHP